MRDLVAALVAISVGLEPEAVVGGAGDLVAGDRAVVGSAGGAEA